MPRSAAPSAGCATRVAVRAASSARRASSLKRGGGNTSAASGRSSRPANTRLATSKTLAHLGGSAAPDRASCRAPASPAQEDEGDATGTRERCGREVDAFGRSKASVPSATRTRAATSFRPQIVHRSGHDGERERSRPQGLAPRPCRLPGRGGEHAQRASIVRRRREHLHPRVRSSREEPTNRNSSAGQSASGAERARPADGRRTLRQRRGSSSHRTRTS